MTLPHKVKKPGCQCKVCQHYQVMLKTSRIRNMADKFKLSHTITIVIRTDGVERAYDGGFLKELIP